MRRLPLLILTLALGCTSAPAEPPAPEIRVVAILPFIDETGRAAFDADEFGAILASEFVKASGVRAIRPQHLRAGLEPGEKIAGVQDAIRAARRAGADTVLACAVTDYDPYDPPRISIHAQLLSVESRAMSTQAVDHLIQSASWRKGPLPMTRDAAGHALAAFEEVYDARDASTRTLLAAYAKRTSLRESDFLAIQPRYLQFVSSQIIHRAWELAPKHGT
jgi:hypothetical protein